mmetsp:Transcript_32671/g.70067  ORF Transcript_32671/g.70067 Transcript_32671/m.70067 type:complete len:264 (-) Transcript_32671:617-1408(-)
MVALLPLYIGSNLFEYWRGAILRGFEQVRQSLPCVGHGASIFKCCVCQGGRMVSPKKFSFSRRCPDPLTNPDASANAKVTITALHHLKLPQPSAKVRAKSKSNIAPLHHLEVSARTRAKSKIKVKIAALLHHLEVTEVSARAKSKVTLLHHPELPQGSKKTSCPMPTQPCALRYILRCSRQCFKEPQRDSSGQDLCSPKTYQVHRNFVEVVIVSVRSAATTLVNNEQGFPIFVDDLCTAGLRLHPGLPIVEGLDSLESPLIDR